MDIDILEKIDWVIKAACVLIAAVMAYLFLCAEYPTDIHIPLTSVLVFLCAIGVTIEPLKEEEESLLKVLLGVFIGIVACVLLSMIPVIGWLIGPLIGGFITGIIAGSKSGYLVLPTYYTAIIFAFLTFKLKIASFQIGLIVDLFGEYPVISDILAEVLTKAGILVFTGILLFCGAFWIYHMILCGIGAVIGNIFHD